jgi:hypothetical protein
MCFWIRCLTISGRGTADNLPQAIRDSKDPTISATFPLTLFFIPPTNTGAVGNIDFGIWPTAALA